MESISMETILQKFHKTIFSSVAAINRHEEINNKNINHELEVIFANNNKHHHITRTDYINVMKELKLHGFTCEADIGEYLLRINNEFET